MTSCFQCLIASRSPHNVVWLNRYVDHDAVCSSEVHVNDVPLCVGIQFTNWKIAAYFMVGRSIVCILCLVGWDPVTGYISTP